MPSSYLPSLIRTGVPLIVGWLLSIPIVARLSDALGITEPQWQQAVAVVIGIVYYAAGRALEQRWPRLGSILVGLGVPAPEYEPRHRADEGVSRVGVAAGLAVVVVTLLAVPASAAWRQPVRWVGVASASACNGRLEVTWVQDELHGREWRPVQDDGRAVRLQVVDSRTGAVRDVPVDRRTEHWLSGPVSADSGGLVRVVVDGVTSRQQAVWGECVE